MPDTPTAPRWKAAAVGAITPCRRVSTPACSGDAPELDPLPFPELLPSSRRVASCSLSSSGCA
eukprot:2715860-Prymnesium_polylepis.1